MHQDTQNVRRRIIDIGCGRNPWIWLNIKREQAKEATALAREFSSLGPEDHYTCVDRVSDELATARTKMQGVQRDHPALLQGTTVFRADDILTDCFSVRSFDVAICADIVSAPPPNTFEWEAETSYERSGYGFLVLDDAAKRQILQRACRLLREDGILIVSVQQSPEYAHATLRWLRDQYQLERSYGTLEPYGDVCCWEGVFRPFVPHPRHRVIHHPSTREVRAYIKRCFAARQCNF